MVLMFWLEFVPIADVEDKMKRIQLLVLCMTALVTVFFAATLQLQAMDGPDRLGNGQTRVLLKKPFSHDWLQVNTGLEDSSVAFAPATNTSFRHDARDQSKAIREDARYYARDFGVDIDEAIRRLNLQEAIGRLNFKLSTQEADFFGGLYVEHQPVFQVVVLFTEDRNATLKSYLENSPLEDFVTTRLVRLSLRELEATQLAASGALASLDVPFEHDINVRENLVEVYVTDLTRAQAVQRTDVVGTLGPHVKLVVVESLSRNTIGMQGGRPLRPTCTTGFSVVHNNGTEGITTAGHCANTMRYGSRRLVYQAGEYVGPYDVQWHTSTSRVDVFRPYFYSGSGSRPVYAVTPRAYQYVGEYVCKYGKETKAGCGVIISKNLNITYIRVHSDTEDLSEFGDSGGPWFVGNYAYGMMTADFEFNYDAIYMALDYISILGLTVKTD
jgi:hypothetical protein